MNLIAIDTATDRCTVAAERDGARASRAIDGARMHASAVLRLLDEVLDELQIRLADVNDLLLADGPGSFTGLRVGASVAKALAWRRPVRWYTAPSLLVRAAAHARPDGDVVVLAVSDALRGELYAGCWRIGTSVSRVGPEPRAVHPTDLAAFGAVDVVVGSIPESLVAAVSEITGKVPVTGPAALPDATRLLQLARVPGAVTEVQDHDRWQPVYGRPAEAQAVWERNHGIQLPDTPGIAR